MHAQADLCADCNASSPQWASVNRGVLLCDECSSIHRHLGRHISQVKHLEKSRWRPSQLSMVHYLASAGANGYWEHILYEPMLTGPNSDNRTSKLLQPHKKPLPTDPMHPTKADFIREKYLFLGFFKKPRNINQDDLNQQLHASVRTGVLETSLYLLALGANPNFLHSVKGTAPIHVACQYGQIGQVELLLAYGADICIRDSSGKTVIDLALDKALALSESITPVDTMKTMSHEEKLQLAWSSMVDLLVSAYYDLTDSLAFFLTRHVPDHKAAFFGETLRNTNYNSDGIPIISNHSKLSIITNNEIINGHFLISTSLIHESNGPPSVTKPMKFKLTSSGLPTVSNAEKTDDQDDWITKAREKLSNLSNTAFSDLCIDVYDEADRRLTNSFLENHDTLNNNDNNSAKHSNDYRIFNGCNIDDNSSDTNNGLHNGVTKESASVIHSVPIPPPHKKTTTLQPHQAATSMTSLTLFFLPPNTTYSPVRNQARQKLGHVLTEASIRLLPLFLPLTRLNTANTASEVSSKKPQKPQHSYTDYFNSTEQQQQLNEFIATRTRNCPLPALPAPSKTRNNNNDAHDVERLHSTNISDISSSPSNSSCDDLSKRLKNQCTNISQEPFISKDLSLDHKHSQLPLSASSSPVIVKNKSSLKKLGRSRDDPVYDQVAGEVDVNGKNPSNVQTVSSHDHNTLSVNTEETGLSNQQTLIESSFVDHSNTSLVSPPSTRRESDHQVQQQQHEGDDDESDSIGQIPPITSRPGPLPGSRRLHLSHTGRIVQHRASVPTTSTTATTASDTTGCGSNPTSLSESTTSIVKSSESSKNATLHSLMNPLSAENANDSRNHLFQSHTHYHHSEPCCVAARNEVERLRKENTELKVQLYDLQNSKDIVEQRLEDLEGRMIQLDSVVQTLKEEKQSSWSILCEISLRYLFGLFITIFVSNTADFLHFAASQLVCRCLLLSVH
ncbi:ARF GTPase-activating protein [Schistosoma japonicum]|uniref:ARF GTPase-activating protein n=1 Tax=Schistosoma japonicum TaxID=6182 RepID=A0A4Z2D6T9_SCHJA|nr:ARF GTPase-activating protein [Schistosoma japonicum]